METEPTDTRHPYMTDAPAGGIMHWLPKEWGYTEAQWSEWAPSWHKCNEFCFPIRYERLSDD